jgi:hypothetical protein
MLDIMKKEFCTRCNTKREVKMTAASKVITDPDGKRKVIQTNIFHCEICKSFVRREKYNRGGILETGDSFTPRAKNIWRAIPGDTQLKILSTVWCTHCRSMSRITHITAKVDSGLLVLMGKCSRCGGDVARVREND